ncbi:MAG: immunity 26/phosphotriesterase HocA family protein [Candidatus Accumulibacter sp.]|jgi:hypothetical protein|nr:immunity 26/phosphotriesterase HocA family protein [Accumulibacter sp.]
MENVILTNDERLFFGLDPIGEDWERVEIKPEFVVYFDGDAIRKKISFRSEPDYVEYHESDMNIKTRERSVVLPQTARGKEKKLNFTSVSGVRPAGVSFSMNLRSKNYSLLYRSRVQAFNVRNNQKLPIANVDKLDTIEEYRAWLKDFIATSPADWFEKVGRMRNEKHKTIKYYNGDIFRFEFDRETYGFGLIIGQIRKMDKDGVIVKKHALNSTMTVPLLVRCYLVQTREKNMSISEISAYPLSDAKILSDNSVIWGTYDIVGNKALSEDDIDFPLQIGVSIEYKNPYARLCWGTGAVIKRKSDDMPEFIENNKYLRHGVAFGVNTEMVLREILEHDSQPGRSESEETDRKTAFAWFGVPEDIGFDEFNKQYGGMTRAQYAEYANQTRRKD